MPELPEVETLKRALATHVVGRRVQQVTVREPRLRWPVDAGGLERWVCGRTIVSVRRRAKYLLLGLEGDSVLMVHLGMSGGLQLHPASTQLRKHDHVVFRLDGNDHLRFNDPRRFGSIDAFAAGEESLHPRLRNLGLEPLDKAFDGAALHARCRNARCSIKALLMDARRVVGVGNIYACEALWLAQIHPRVKACSVGPRRCARLAEAIQQTLRAAIERGGTTLRDFRSVDGSSGDYRNALRVYGCAGQDCARCGRRLRKTVQMGRSTFFCPGCQRR